LELKSEYGGVACTEATKLEPLRGNVGSKHRRTLQGNFQTYGAGCTIVEAKTKELVVLQFILGKVERVHQAEIIIGPFNCLPSDTGANGTQVTVISTLFPHPPGNGSQALENLLLKKLKESELRFLPPSHGSVNEKL
jgi:hypothetical protein